MKICMKMINQIKDNINGRRKVGEIQSRMDIEEASTLFVKFYFLNRVGDTS